VQPPSGTLISGSQTAPPESSSQWQSRIC